MEEVHILSGALGEVYVIHVESEGTCCFNSAGTFCFMNFCKHWFSKSQRPQQTT